MKAESFFFAINLLQACRGDRQFGLSIEEHDQVKELFGLGQRDELVMRHDIGRTNVDGIIRTFRHFYDGLEVYSSEAEVLELMENGDWLPYNTSKLIFGLDRFANPLPFDEAPNETASIEACFEFARSFHQSAILPSLNAAPIQDSYFVPQSASFYQRLLYLYISDPSRDFPAMAPGRDRASQKGRFNGAVYRIKGPLVFMDRVRIFDAVTEVEARLAYNCFYDASQKQLLRHLNYFEERSDR